MKKIKVWVKTKKGNGFEVELPAVNVVCGRCDGEGKHVNPNVDGHGISPEEFDEDPDFEEAYFSGRYDIRCEDCEGERVVLEIDMDRISPKMKDRVYRQQDADAADRREEANERRWGC